MVIQTNVVRQWAKCKQRKAKKEPSLALCILRASYEQIQPDCTRILCSESKIRHSGQHFCGVLHRTNHRFLERVGFGLGLSCLSEYRYFDFVLAY